MTADTVTGQADVDDNAGDAESPESTGDAEDTQHELQADQGDDGADDRHSLGERLRWLPTRPHRQALLAGLAMMVAVAGLAGWLGWEAHRSQAIIQQRAEFLSAARQGALNLTTIDWQHADSDVHRILNSATGTFHDEFSKRTQPFIEVVKQTQSKTEGAITAAGLESASSTEAQVLVAVSVKTSSPAGPEQNPRSWRMRISVQKVGQDMKVSNVEFVP